VHCIRHGHNWLARELVLAKETYYREAAIIAREHEHYFECQRNGTA
jgi:hypothetical protein